MEVFPRLKQLGIVDQISASSIKFNKLQNQVVISVGHLLELHALKETKNATYEDLLLWLLALHGISIDNVYKRESSLKLHRVVKHMLEEKSKLQKTKNDKALSKLNFFLETLLDFTSFIVNQKTVKRSQDSNTNNDVFLKIRRLESLTDAVTKNYQQTKEENKTLRETNIQLENKLKTKEIDIDKANRQIKQLKSTFKHLKSRLSKMNLQLIATKRHLYGERTSTKTIAREDRKRLQSKVKYWESVAATLRTKNKLITDKSNNEKAALVEEITQLEMKVEQQNSEKNEMRSYLENLEYNELNEIDLTVESRNGKYTYTRETDMCIMNMLENNVPFDKIGNVIETVLALANIKVKHDRLPKKDYVSSVNLRKLAISQAQVAEICSNKENQTLYTDETRKDGQSYGVFMTTDENKDPYLLGLRQMSSKASKTELETFKAILGDIETRVAAVKENDTEANSVRCSILKNITSTMSDRAATELCFKELLCTYRRDLLAEHIEKFNEMSEQEQYLLSKMYNFFCGLHLLINIADLMSTIFIAWEKQRGNANAKESGILRLVQNSCKAFATGADNKNGASLEFRTYLQRINVQYQQIKPFHGNRFNVVFHNGGAIYHLREQIIYFLANIKSEGKEDKLNWLLRSVLSDMRAEVHCVGLRALGLFNKFITTPLWKLMESHNTHILDMNEHYRTLVQYLESMSSSVGHAKEFITGEYIPFPNIAIKKDDIWSSLVLEQENDSETVSLVMEMGSAVCKALKEKVKDHLEGGVFDGYNSDRSRFNSVIPHNKLPEWVFGHLDWLLKHRPNASRISNEAHLVFHVNKTAEWMRNKTAEENEKLLRWSKQRLSELKNQEKERLKQIREEMERLSKEKENKSNERILKADSEKQKLTEEIVKDGFWNSIEEVNKQVDSVKSGKQCRERLIRQIKFRQLVLQQQGEKQLFQTSRIAGKSVTNAMLKDNLLSLIVRQTPDKCDQEYVNEE